mmetsp:Transcript_48028/g.124758  ORF Transcript_48028/g.124758 Transcript_48028/m.124758 type:complete len:393 (-) Transcript_48028:672-1850(-)
MPPKKAAQAVEKPLLGRPGNHVKAGIVGLPNVGKSTTFNLLCQMSVAAENYPFCTLDPSESRVQVPDDRWEYLCEHHKPVSRVPAFLTVMDIAGLVKGAAEGAGLGNAFLSHIKATDAIFHVVRAFDDADIVHVEDTVDPVRDMNIITEELRKKDIEQINKLHDSVGKLVERGQKEHKKEFETLEKVKALLDAGQNVRSGDWNAHDIEFLNQYQLLTAKSVMYLANMSKKDFERKKNKHLPKIKAWIDENDKGAPLIPYSAAFEEEWINMAPAEQEAIKSDKGITSMFPKIITTGYKMLHLIRFFTAGQDEVKAWTIREKTKAPQAAGTIHTDFERGFIMAEVMHFPDFKEHGSEAAVKSAGKYRQQGKEYVVEDGDIIFFKFNVTADKKKK